MSAEALKELSRLVDQAVAEVAALRKENASLEKRIETLRRDLRSRTEALKATEGESAGWGEERGQLRERVASLVEKLAALESA